MSIKLIAGATAASLLAGIGMGFVVGQWRADAACAGATGTLQGRIEALIIEKGDLVAAIADVNKGVAVAHAKTLAAEDARLSAEKHAADLAAFSQSRLDKLQRSFESATSCDDVLRSYWELRQ